MDRVAQYRQIICDFLREFAERDSEAQIVFDSERDHYLVMRVGWHGESPIYGCAMQLNLIDEKIWIQHNSTEVFIVRELIERGVPRQDIVLGLRSPSIRTLLSTALLSTAFS